MYILAVIRRRHVFFPLKLTKVTFLSDLMGLYDVKSENVESPIVAMSTQTAVTTSKNIRKTTENDHINNDDLVLMVT